MTTQIDAEMIKMVVSDAISFMVALTNYIDQPAIRTQWKEPIRDSTIPPNAYCSSPQKIPFSFCETPGTV